MSRESNLPLFFYPHNTTIVVHNRYKKLHKWYDLGIAIYYNSSIIELTKEITPQEVRDMRKWRIRGTWFTVNASCAKQALLKLVDSDGDFVYKNHWNTKRNTKSWAEFETSYGYKGIVEEV